MTQAEPGMNPELDGDAPDISALPQYRPVRVLGRGGMGVVWLAEQLRPVQRLVALKLAGGPLTPKMCAWFEVERVALARMRHPGIAQLLDAGELPDGRPYFVMEYVEGLPITTWCLQNRPPLRARVELLQRVCLAVQHAHSKGLVHRDLKPANLLVLEVDGVAHPKLIDFGVAVAVAARSPSAGTPGYMSPEQASGIDQTDTRSDVYALGVVMGEILAGLKPAVPRQDFQTAWLGMHDAARAELARASACSLRHLTRVLREDLGPLIDACTATDASRRPASAQQIADELGRWLNAAPLQLREHERHYVLRNRVRRYRWWLTGAAVFVIGLGTALGLAVRANTEAQLQRDLAMQARAEADRQAQIASSVNRFLVDDLLGAANIDEYAQAESLTVRQLLEDSAQRLLAAQLDQQGGDDILFALGSTLAAMGRYESAEQALRSAARLRLQSFGHNDPRTLAALLAAAGTRIEQSDGAALNELSSIYDAIAALQPGQPALMARAEMTLARHLTFIGNYQRALELSRSALSRDILNQRDRYALRVQLAWVLSRLGAHAEALKIQREVLLEAHERFGSDAWPSIIARAGLASALHRSGDHAAALNEREWVIDQFAERFPEHVERGVQLSHYAALLVTLGRYDEAERSARESIRILGARFGDEHRVLGNAYSHLGAALGGQGELIGAVDALTDADRIYRRQFTPEHPLRQTNDQRLREARRRLSERG
jgi:non-specific serine/threonine protein kinase/serine/threonine-protein kinase